jgi:hypothetical protein
LTFTTHLKKRGGFTATMHFKKRGEFTAETQRDAEKRKEIASNCPDFSASLCDLGGKFSDRFPAQLVGMSTIFAKLCS